MDSGAYLMFSPLLFHASTPGNYHVAPTSWPLNSRPFHPGHSFSLMNFQFPSDSMAQMRYGFPQFFGLRRIHTAHKDPAQVAQSPADHHRQALGQCANHSGAPLKRREPQSAHKRFSSATLRSFRPNSIQAPEGLGWSGVERMHIICC